MGHKPGEILGGRYRLIRPLATGGMGSVWKAEHLSLNAAVALKLIEGPAQLDSSATLRFLREARLAAALRSPHVVQILDQGIDGTTPYIAMELLEGESLADRLERVGRLSAAETARVIQHLARAMTRAHEAGIIHRDLKPENIFIVRNDDEEIFKVFDFGIAKVEAPVGNATRTGSLLGTPSYMSPEQAEGAKTLDQRTDIWALGVIAYRCLLGQLPFCEPTLPQLVLAICTRPLPVPSRKGSVPEGFDAWFARACARSPADRFASARRASAELSAVLGAPSALEEMPSSATNPLLSSVDPPAAGALKPPPRYLAAPALPASAVTPRPVAASLPIANARSEHGARRSKSAKHWALPISLAIALPGAALGVSRVTASLEQRALASAAAPALEQVTLSLAAPGAAARDGAGLPDLPAGVRLANNVRVVPSLRPAAAEPAAPVPPPAPLPTPAVTVQPVDGTSSARPGRGAQALDAPEPRRPAKRRARQGAHSR
ncbi:MAG TPA: serine/threonine-protein kinase [Polyangiaceae bacterium]|nr:serine/threonine-protein kinase [Polyangiaceae bacterium]